MGQSDDRELVELLRKLGVYQAQINAELAKGAKANRDKIAKAFAAGKDFARDAAPYCHSPPRPAARRTAGRVLSPCWHRHLDVTGHSLRS